MPRYFIIAVLGRLNLIIIDASLEILRGAVDLIFVVCQIRPDFNCGLSDGSLFITLMISKIILNNLYGLCLFNPIQFHRLNLINLPLLERHAPFRLAARIDIILLDLHARLFCNLNSSLCAIINRNRRHLRQRHHSRKPPLGRPRGPLLQRTHLLHPYRGALRDPLLSKGFLLV